MSRITANCREFRADSGQFSTEKLASFDQVREGGGRILARGSSAVLEDKMEYELFAICVHAGGAHGGHYFAYCKPFGDTGMTGKPKAAGTKFRLKFREM